MISAWWLLLIPVAGGIGAMFGGICAAKGYQDDCADYQYNCMNCSKNKEKSK